ncbi:hypothetical protein WDV06_27210 [Streptomyces racemochromogenes]|uniref:Uncharacterized protein n=1 Tax=Streptomyces racemochromogenes TaxID=67353 RepID=A0ABW7PKH5_9ACTN
MWGSESDGGTSLDVRFPDRLSAPERASLRREIARLPGISRGAPCSVSTCG